MGDALYAHIPPAKPAKGDSYIDPNFHTTITRITDGEVEVPGHGIHPEYGTYRSISSDGRYLLLVDRAGFYRVHSAHAPYHTIKKWKPDWGTDAGLGHEQPEYRWDYSGDHPTWLYWRSHKKLIRTDFNDIPHGMVLAEGHPANVVVHDFNSDRTVIENGSAFDDQVWDNMYIANGDAGTPSENTRYWAFGLYEATYHGKVHYRLFVYDKTGDAIVAIRNIEGGSLNETYISPDGEYVYVGLDACAPWNATQPLCGGWIYRKDLSNWGDPDFFMCSIPPHTNWMYDAQGYIGMLYMDNQTDYLTFKRAVDGTEWNIRHHTQGEGADWGRAGKHHGAMPGPQRRGWGLVATYSTGHNDHQGWDDDAVYLVEVNQNKYYGGPEEPRVWRIADLNNDSTVNYYQHHPNASMNYEGTKIWYGSNWDTAGGISDVYQIDLPATWWEDLASSTDITPPVRSNRAPAGTLAQGTDSATVSLVTDGDATCKYSITTTQVAYDDMPYTFSTTGGTYHSFELTGLSDGMSYNIYVRCMDGHGNKNTDDFPISFNVANGDGSGCLDKILFIGNSYTGHSGGVQNHLHNMLTESGRTVEVAGEIHGGQAFSYINDSYIGLVNIPEVTARINSDRWDAVVLQSYYEPEQAFYEAGGILIDRVRNNGSEPVLFMIWGHEDHPDQDAIFRSRTEQLGSYRKVPVAPIGIGIRNAKNQDIDVYADGAHLSLKGAYLAAAMYYAFFTGESPVGLEYNGLVGSGYFGTLTLEETASLQQIAWQTIADYGVFWNGGYCFGARADVNNSSSINSTDAMLALRYSLELDMSGTGWHASPITGDVTCDGSVTETDAVLILRYSLGLVMDGTGWCGE